MFEAKQEKLDAIAARKAEEEARLPAWIRDNHIPYKFEMGGLWVGVDIEVKFEGFENGDHVTSCIWPAKDAPPVKARVWVYTENASATVQLDKDSIDGDFPHMLRHEVGACLYIQDFMPSTVRDMDSFNRAKWALERGLRRANMNSLLAAPNFWAKAIQEMLPDELKPILNDKHHRDERCVRMVPACWRLMPPKSEKEEDWNT